MIEPPVETGLPNIPSSSDQTDLPHLYYLLKQNQIT